MGKLQKDYHNCVYERVFDQRESNWDLSRNTVGCNIFSQVETMWLGSMAKKTVSCYCGKLIARLERAYVLAQPAFSIVAGSIVPKLGATIIWRRSTPPLECSVDPSPYVGRLV